MHERSEQEIRLSTRLTKAYDRLLDGCTRGACPPYKAKLHRRIVRYTPGSVLMGVLLGLNFWMSDRWTPSGAWWILIVPIAAFILNPVGELLVEWLIFSRNRI